MTQVYLGAKLQRVEKMPSLEKLLRPKRKATFREFVDRLEAAPTHIVAGK